VREERGESEREREGGDTTLGRAILARRRLVREGYT